MTTLKDVNVGRDRAQYCNLAFFFTFLRDPARYVALDIDVDSFPGTRYCYTTPHKDRSLTPELLVCVFGSRGGREREFGRNRVSLIP